MKTLRFLFFFISITSAMWLNAQYKVPVYTGHATQIEPNMDLGNALDGDVTTLYHSSWRGGTLPDTLDFQFIDVVRVDSMIYYPRADNQDNGNFGNVSIYWSSKDNPTVFTKLLDENYNMSRNSKKIALNGANGILNPAIIRIVVLTGSGGFSSCAEMVFKSPVQYTNAECDPTTQIVPDTKLTITNAIASNYQPGTSGEGPVTYSYDGNDGTFYHSNWGGGGFPISLTYNLSNADKVDYLIYHPRPGGGNGSFQEGEVWYATTSDPNTYIKNCDFNFNGSSSASKLTLPSPIVTPSSIKVIVKSGVNNYASCAEMEFYKINTNIGVPPAQIFKDAICSDLQSGVTQETINAMPNGFYKSLAQCLSSNQYNKKFRIKSCEPYQTLNTTQAQLKVSGWYSTFENPTGIFFNSNSNVVVFVENSFGQSIYLRVHDYDTQKDARYPLQTGVNRITIADKGLSYVDYYTDNYANLQPINIHIVGGVSAGFYDLKTNNLTSYEWKKCLQNSPSTMFNLRGKYINMLYPVKGLKQYSSESPKELAEIYDTIVKIQYTQMGLVKYNKVPKNRMQAECTYNDGSWHGGSVAHFGGGIDVACSVDEIKKNNCWGIAHELGHNNQIGPCLKWVSTTETTNNIYSVWTTFILGTKPGNKKLETENHNDAYYYKEEIGSTTVGKGNEYIGARFNAYLNNAIVKRQPWMCQYGPDAMGKDSIEWKNGNTDSFVKLCPLWQLELYNQVVHPENINWFGDLAEQVRLDPNSSNYPQGQCLVNFMKHTCDVVQLNLIDFFRKTGMLNTYNRVLRDYGNALFSVTSADTTDVVNYITTRGYPKPESPVLHYLSANSVDILKNKLPLEGIVGQGITTDLNYPVADSYERNIVVDHAVWKNALVFETYSGNTLSRISMVGGGYLDNSKTRVYYPDGSTSVYAVGWDGSRKLVYPAIKTTMKPTINITTTNATIRWEATSAPSIGYEYYVSTSSTKPTVNGIFVNNDTVRVTNLTCGTTYYAFTRIVFSDNDKSDWSESTTFNTEVCPCEAPTVNTVTNITSSSATIGWSIPNYPPQNGYEYVCSTTATAPTTNGTAVIAGTTSVNITNLTSGTAYYVFVRSKCSGSTYSAWSNAYSFISLIPNGTYNIYSISSSKYIKAGGTTSGSSILTENLVNGASNQIWQVTYLDNGNYSLSPLSASTLFLSYEANNAQCALRTAINPIQDAIKWTIVPTETAGQYNFKAVSNNGQYLDEFDGTTIGVWEKTGTGGNNNKFVLTPASPCSAPTGLTASNIGTNTATISWTAPTTAPANGYEYVCSTTSTVPTGTGTALTAGITSVNLTSLIGGTTYYVYVRSKCNATSYSIWSAVCSFATINQPIVSGIYNIYSISNNRYMKAGGTTAGSSVLSQALVSGTADQMWKVTDLGNNTYTLSPLSANTLFLSYENSNTQCALRSATSPLQSEIKWTIVQTEIAGQYNIKAISNNGQYLDEYGGTTIGVWGKSGTGDSNNKFVFIPMPSNVTATNIGANSASISWTAASPTPNNGYEYVCSTTATTPTTAGTAVTASISSVNITNLTAGTTYYVFVRSKCSTTVYSSWTTAYSFTTTTQLIANGVYNIYSISYNRYIKAGGTTAGSSVLSQALVSGAADQKWQVTYLGNNSYTLSPLSASNLFLAYEANNTQCALRGATTPIQNAIKWTILSTGTAGQYNIKAVSNNGQYLNEFNGTSIGVLARTGTGSNNNKFVFVATTSSQRVKPDNDDSSGNNIFKIYPNPSKGLVNISLPKDMINSIIIVRDISGRIVLTNTEIGKPERIVNIDKSHGVYFITTNSNNATITQKVIIE